MPLGAYSGWNVRGKRGGAEGMLGRFTGSWMPFARTKAERQASGDPRRSVQERYPTRADYISKIAGAVLDLRRRKLLLDEDAVRILERSRRHELWKR